LKSGVVLIGFLLEFGELFGGDFGHTMLRRSWID